MGRLSRCESARVQGLFYVGAIVGVAAVTIALSLPSGAGANSSPRSEGKDRHGAKHKGKRHGDSPVQEAPAGDPPANGSPVDVTAPASGDSQPVTAFQFPAVKVHGGVATFRLRGIVPRSIRSAYVTRGHKKRRLSLGRIRAAARRGVLRLRISKAHASRRSRQATASARRKKKTTLVIVTTPPPPTTTTTTPPPTTTALTPIVSWRPAGSLPLSDAQATALVTPKAEVRPDNVAPNHYVPTTSELTAFHNAVYGAGPNAGSRADAYNPLLKYVTGGFTGTTDEIIQWAAHKWGIPEDVLRAVAVNETHWHQSEMGDRRDGVNASLYPAQARIDSDSVYESMGLMQVKWRPDGSMNPGTEPLRWESTAFNVDYAGAGFRYYFDGYCSWCNPGYAPGQEWESIGAHYDPSPWRNTGMLDYITRIQTYLAARTWEQAGF
jgi:hypothetical protein